ncbi:MAG: hypothetical protein IKH03_04720 [Oscillospiraceae bacterium]|nr:hypothetical protein [Oscillospiraceae bacterium]
MLRRGITILCCLLALALGLCGPVLALDYSGVAGVVQQGSLATFARRVPAATVTLDAARMDDPDSAVFTALRPDFALDADSAHEQTFGCACYIGATRMHADNYIEGPCFRYLYPDAARLADGTYADVLITYSDIHIFTPTQKAEDYLRYGSIYEGWTACARGRTVRAANNNQMHIGLLETVNIRIVGKGGYPVRGSFRFAVRDIDISREGQTNYTALFQAGRNGNFSEQIQILDGAVSPAYIPGAGTYRCLIEGEGGADSADGLRFLPGGNDNDSFNSGFVVLADAADGITLNCWSSGGGVNPATGARNWQDSVLLATLPGYPLSVSKTVTGNLGDTARTWHFTLSLQNADGSPVTDLTAPEGARDWDDADRTSGKYSFTLRHGERLELPGLAENTRYQLTEEALDDYAQSYTVQDGSANDGVTQYSRVTAQRTLSAAAALDFTGDRSEPEPEAEQEPAAEAEPTASEPPQETPDSGGASAPTQGSAVTQTTPRRTQTPARPATQTPPDSGKQSEAAHDAAQQVPGGGTETPAGQGTPDTPDANGEAQTDPDADGEAQADPDADGETQTDPDADGETQTDPDADGEAQTEPDADGEARTEPDAKGETRTEPDADGEAQTDPDAGGEARTEPDAKGETRNESDAGGVGLPPLPTGVRDSVAPALALLMLTALLAALLWERRRGGHDS